MMGIPLVDEDEMLSRKREFEREFENNKQRKNAKKHEKPIRVIRIRHYQKIILTHSQKDVYAFAVDRSLEDLLKSLYFNTNIQGPPSDYIFVEKDQRMESNEKFIFIDISREEFSILKRQLENHTTINAYNKGEFIIMEGRRNSLAETFNIPRIYRYDGNEGNDKQISETNVILMRARLRQELKDDLCAYHSYTDDQIDEMKENELIALKKVANRKKDIENRHRKKIQELLK